MKIENRNNRQERCVWRVVKKLSDYKLKSETFIFLFDVQGIILFKEKAKEALEKARNANNGNLLLRNKKVTWKVLEGHAEKEALKKANEDNKKLFEKIEKKSLTNSERYAKLSKLSQVRDANQVEKSFEKVEKST